MTGMLWALAAILGIAVLLPLFVQLRAFLGRMRRRGHRQRMIAALSQVLGAPIDPVAFIRSLESPEQVGPGPTKQQALDAMVALAGNDADLSGVLHWHRHRSSSLPSIYSTLCAAGAGQWAGGVWIPVAALLTPDVLDFLIGSPELSDTERAYAVVSHFKAGRPIPRTAAAWER
jgi:hypothetical protein